MSVSALIATEFCFITHIVLAGLSIAFFVFGGGRNIPVICLGIANYFLQIFSGGFVAGILFSFYDLGERSHTICVSMNIIAACIMIVSCALLLHTAGYNGPFNVTWWIDLVLFALVNLTCRRFIAEYL